MKTLPRIILIFLLFSGSLLSTSAQDNWGIKAGLNLSDIRSIGSSGNGLADPYQPVVGFHIGAFATLPFQGNLSLRPELEWSAKGALFEDVENITTRLNYASLNLLADLKLGEAGHVFVGPQLSYLLNGKIKSSNASIDLDVQQGFNRAEISLMAGAAYDLNALLEAGARVAWGLTNMQKLALTNIQGAVVGDIRNRNTLFQLYLALKL